MGSTQQGTSDLLLCQTGCVCKQRWDPLANCLQFSDTYGKWECLHVRLNFAKVCFDFSAVVCSWIVWCRNDLSCFSFSFQHSVRPASECKESTEFDQFSFEENKRSQIVTSCDKCVLEQSHSEETRRKRLAFCSFGWGSAYHLCQWTSCMKICFNYSSGFFVVDKWRNMI